MSRFSAIILLVVAITSPTFSQVEQLAAKSQQGREALESGRFEEAVSIYSELVQALPDNPGLRMNLGLAQYMAGRPSPALEQFQAVLKVAPDMVPALVLAGAVLLEMGRFGEAVDSLRRVVDQEPGHREARQMMVEALMTTERFSEAVVHLRELSRIEPEDSRNWYFLGRAYESLSQAAFEELQKSDPESPYWFVLIGDAVLSRGQFSSAFYFYRQALERDPGFRGVHRSLAEIYRANGQAEWAKQEEAKEREIPEPDCSEERLECAFQAGRQQEIITLTEGDTRPEAWFWRSRAYNQLALEALNRLGQLPPSPELHKVRAEIHTSQGRHREAVQELESALRLDPDSWDLKLRMAEALLRIRDHSAAQSLLEQLLQVQPEAPELNFLYGDSLLQSEQTEKALTYLKRAVAGDDSLLPAHSSLGRALLLEGDHRQARPHLEKALEIDEDGSLHFQLARVYQHLGLADESRQALQKYQEIQKQRQEERARLEEEVQITPPE